MMKGLTQLILNMYRPIICSSTSLTCISYVVHEWISLSGFHRKYIVQRCRCRKHVFHFRCQDDIVFFYVFHKKSMNYRHRNDVRVPAGWAQEFWETSCGIQHHTHRRRVRGGSGARAPPGPRTGGQSPPRNLMNIIFKIHRFYRYSNKKFVDLIF